MLIGHSVKKEAQVYEGEALAALLKRRIAIIRELKTIEDGGGTDTRICYEDTATTRTASLVRFSIRNVTNHQDPSTGVSVIAIGNQS